MQFGEIVEPSTRALWDDEITDYPENEINYVWLGNSEVPKVVNNVFIGETNQILSVYESCIILSRKPLCELKDTGVKIYQIENNNYIITKASSTAIIGKITELIIPWLKAAKEIYTITSNLLTLYQSNNVAEMTSSPCIIRKLETSIIKKTGNYFNLDVPNLVTGLSASVLSYCKHENLPCILYIAFFDEVTLDSLNTTELTNLLKHLGIKTVKEYVSISKIADNNLYM